jgi:hypothetical protein
MSVRRLPVVPTDEQRRARDAFAADGDLAVVAGAGTGKTSTLILMAAATRRRGLYLAFNRATAADAIRRFGANVDCRTAHSLAFAATGRQSAPAWTPRRAFHPPKSRASWESPGILRSGTLALARFIRHAW